MTSPSNSKCTCDHTLDEHTRESLICSYRHCPCTGFNDSRNKALMRAQAKNSLLIALRGMRERAEKARLHANQLGLSQLASDCELYAEDIAMQIANLNETYRRPNVAVAQL